MMGNKGMVGGDEYEALSRKNRRLIHWKKDEIAKASRANSQRKSTFYCATWLPCPASYRTADFQSRMSKRVTLPSSKRKMCVTVLSFSPCV